jgi:protein TonB
MFAESMLETSWAQRGRRSWTTLTSFGLQMVVIAVLLAVPLITTVGMPLARTASTPVILGRVNPGPPPSDPARGAFHGRAMQIIPYTGRIMAPSHVPTTIVNGDDRPIGDPTPAGYVGPSIGDGPSLPIPFSGTSVVPVPPAPKPASRPLVSSRLLQGSLIHRVDPPYPQIAKSAGIQGAVVLEAIVGKDGSMENLRLISGHPLLVRAAIDAVSQWRYKPYVLNGDAIEVETQITVNFILAR